MKFSKTLVYVAITVFGILAYFPLFMDLGTLPLGMWDEAGNAVNAVEMAFNGNYLRRYYEGQPDYFETKPTLFICIQVLFLKTVGFNELALRLPSALFALATLIVIVRFFQKEFKSVYWGIICCLVLITSDGYVSDHVIRTGDHDAALTFFQTVIVLYFFKFLNHKDERKKYIAIVFAAVALAILTKSIAGIMMLPGLVVFTFINKKVKYVLSYPGTYIGFGLMILVVGSYYVLANNNDPLYLKTVWENELFPRYFNASKTHKFNISPITFYFDNFLNGRFVPWIYFLPLCLSVFAFSKNDKLKQFTLLLIVTSISFFIIISKGTTNIWYDAPLFPLLAILTGLGIVIVIQFFYNKLQIDAKWKNALVLIVVAGIFFAPYKKIVKKVYKPKLSNWGDVQYGAIISKMKKEIPQVKSFTVYQQAFNSHLIFYREVNNTLYNYSIKSTSRLEEVNVGDTIMSCQFVRIEEMDAKFVTEELYSYKDCKLIYIKSIR